MYADSTISQSPLNPALFTTEAAPYWTMQAKHLAMLHPWTAQLREMNREQAALMISQHLGISLMLGRAKHDDLTGVHKTMFYDKPESVRPSAMEAPFRAVLSRIPNLKVISPALAAALQATESELQPSTAHS